MVAANVVEIVAAASKQVSFFIVVPRDLVIAN
jgi:hypothetical protein